MERGSDPSGLAPPLGRLVPESGIPGTTLDLSQCSKTTFERLALP